MTCKLFTTLPLFCVLLFQTSGVCAAQEYERPPFEVVTSTDHPFGDAVARGVEFVLRPLRVGAGRAYFSLFKPPVTEHVTVIRMKEPPERPSPQTSREP